MSSTKMSVAEAIKWCWAGPTDNELAALYPTLKDFYERTEAWIDANRDKIKEAMPVYLSLHADKFAPDVRVDPSGSLFEKCDVSFYVPIYWTPSTIRREHEGFVYTVSSPQHVAALHAFRDWEPAFAYLQAHCDSRVAVEPMVFHVSATWNPDVFPGDRHPDSTDSVILPTWRAVAETDKGKGRVRYTLYGWRKRQAYGDAYDWRARQRYFSEHYDLREVLDVEGRVVSSEHGTDFVQDGPARL